MFSLKIPPPSLPQTAEDLDAENLKLMDLLEGKQVSVVVGGKKERRVTEKIKVGLSRDAERVVLVPR